MKNKTIYKILAMILSATIFLTSCATTQTKVEDNKIETSVETKEETNLVLNH